MDIPTQTYDDFLRFLSTLTPIHSESQMRDVYLLEEDKVIKVGEWEYDNFWTNGQNKREAETWEKYKGTEYERYLVPVLAYDPEGRWLIQQKVTPLRKNDPEPDDGWYDFLEQIGIDDLGYRNVGRWEGRYVALDYGMDSSSEE